MSVVVFIPLVVVVLFIVVALVWLWARILRKTGFSHRWSLVAAIPVLNIPLLWFVAFAPWSRERSEAARVGTGSESQEKPLFLSYCREQLYFAENLTANLHAKGIHAWLDIQQLSPSTDWSEAIDKALDEAPGLVLVLSQAAVASPYVESEWQRALRAGKRIHVVAYEDVDIPQQLAEANVLDFRRDFNGAVDRLVSCIKDGSARRETIRTPDSLGRFLIAPTGVLYVAFAIFWLALASPIIALGLPLTGTLKSVVWAAVLFFSAWLVSVGIRFLGRRYTEKSLGAAFILPLFYLLVRVFPVSMFVFGMLVERNLVTEFLLVFMDISAFIGIGGFFLLNLSPDLLRWAPFGQASHQIRGLLSRVSIVTQAEAVQAKSSQYVLLYNPSDEPVAKTVGRVLEKAGHRATAEAASGTPVILILSENTPLALLDETARSSGRVIPLLISNIETSDQEAIAALFKHQLVDYRNRSRHKLKMLAESLRYPADRPPGFSEFALPEKFTKAHVPRPVLGLAFLLAACGVMACSAFIWECWKILYHGDTWHWPYFFHIPAGCFMLLSADRLIGRRMSREMLLFWLIAYTPALFYSQILFYSAEVREWFTGFVLAWWWFVAFMIVISGFQIWLSMRDWLPKRGESGRDGRILALKGIDRYRWPLLAGAFAFFLFNWFAFAPLMDLWYAGLTSG